MHATQFILAVLQPREKLPDARKVSIVATLEDTAVVSGGRSVLEQTDDLIRYSYGWARFSHLRLPVQTCAVLIKFSTAVLMSRMDVIFKLQI